MYSYEIDELLRNNNYSLPSHQYINVCLGSPQINSVEYKPYENKYEISTSDGYFWKIEVKGVDIYD